jgi:hypothetical protein
MGEANQICTEAGKIPAVWDNPNRKHQVNHKAIQV